MLLELLVVAGCTACIQGERKGKRLDCNALTAWMLSNCTKPHPLKRQGCGRERESKGQRKEGSTSFASIGVCKILHVKTMVSKIKRH